MNNKDSKYEKRRKRRIFLSILMVLFVGIILTASTYAWFTANQTVTVNQIDVSVAAQNGLQISTDADTWKTVITNEDIETTTTGSDSKYSSNENMIPFKSKGQIVPVSTAGEIGASAGKLAFFAGTLQNNATTDALELTATAVTENKGTSGQLVAFDLFFRVDVDSQVYLTPNSSVTNADDTDKGLKNAARVAWLREGSGDFSQTLATWQGYKATATTDATSNTSNNLLIWEPNSDTHTPSGTLNARLYGYTSTSSTSLAYKGVKAAISTPVAVDSQDTNYFSTVKGLFTTTNTSGVPAGTQWFKLTAGVTKVRFYLWIEGQDVDCENGASGSSISYNMQFSLLNT